MKKYIICTFLLLNAYIHYVQSSAAGTGAEASNVPTQQMTKQKALSILNIQEENPTLEAIEGAYLAFTLFPELIPNSTTPEEVEQAYQLLKTSVQAMTETNANIMTKNQAFKILSLPVDVAPREIKRVYEFYKNNPLVLPKETTLEQIEQAYATVQYFHPQLAQSKKTVSSTKTIAPSNSASPQISPADALRILNLSPLAEWKEVQYQYKFYKENPDFITGDKTEQQIDNAYQILRQVFTPETEANQTVTTSQPAPKLLPLPPMTKQQALAILELSDGSSWKQIKGRYNFLKEHPNVITLPTTLQQIEQAYYTLKLIKRPNVFTETAATLRRRTPPQSSEQTNPPLLSLTTSRHEMNPDDIHSALKTFGFYPNSFPTWENIDQAYQNFMINSDSITSPAHEQQIHNAYKFLKQIYKLMYNKNKLQSTTSNN